MITTLGASAYSNGNAGNTGWAVFQGSLTALLWVADFYGAWNGARHRQL
jgi:hypothetical protein